MNATLLFLPHFSWAELKDRRLFLCTQKAYFSQILFTNLSKSVLVNEIIHPPHRCGISRCWLDSMIIAQVCLRLATIKDHSKMYSFTVLGGSENQSVSGVTTICLTQCNTSPSHRVDQVVDCGLWDVGPLLFNVCVKLLDIGRNWSTLSYTPIQSIQTCSMGTCPVSMLVMQELGCFQLPGIVYRSLHHGAVHYHATTWGDGCGWMAQQWASGSHHGISVHSKCHQ